MSVVVLHRDSLTLPDETVADAVDVMITDPPYSEHVHSSATSSSSKRGTRKRDMGFESLSVRCRRAVARWASLVRRWSVVYSDVESSNWLSLAAQARGVEYIRTLPWVRWSMPQLSGDRPPQGFEHLVLFHPKGKKRWNGAGNLTHLSHLALRGEGKHKAEKPLDQALDLVSWFSDPGETVFDPFAGSGTLGLACALLGRNYLGVELDAEWAEKARARVSAATLSERDQERINRWLAQPSDSEHKIEGPSRLRAAAREEDKERVAVQVQLGFQPVDRRLKCFIPAPQESGGLLPSRGNTFRKEKEDGSELRTQGGPRGAQQDPQPRSTRASGLPLLIRFSEGKKGS